MVVEKINTNVKILYKLPMICDEMMSSSDDNEMISNPPQF